MQTTIPHSQPVIIIATFQPDGHLVAASPFPQSVGYDEAIGSILHTLCPEQQDISSLELRCFQSTNNMTVFQYYPHPNKELHTFLRNLSPSHTVNASQAYWLYKNGYSPLTDALDTNLKNNILLYQTSLPENKANPVSSMDSHNITTLIAEILSSKDRLSNRSINQIGDITSPRDMETCLSACWEHFTQVHYDNAIELLSRLSSNTHFHKLLCTKEFTKQYTTTQNTLATILLLPPTELNAAHKTLLAATLTSLKEELRQLSVSQTEAESFLQFGTALRNMGTHPLANYLEQLNAAHTQTEKQVNDILSLLYPSPTNNQVQHISPDTAITTFDALFNTREQFQLDETLQQIAQCGTLPKPDEVYTQALSIFYQSLCWKSDPAYALSVQDALLCKLSSLQALPFSPDLLKIAQIQAEDMPDNKVKSYIDVLTHYTASCNYPEKESFQQLLNQCTQNLSVQSGIIRKPMDFIPTFSAALSQGIPAFLSANNGNVQQLTQAARYYGLDTLLSQVQYCSTGNQDSTTLVQSRYAETLLVSAITLLTQTIPNACTENLLFKGWAVGIVQLSSPGQTNIPGFCTRLTTNDKSEVIHPLFGNSPKGYLTEIDLLLNNAISQYTGTEPDQQQIDAFITRLDQAPLELAFSPEIVWTLRQQNILQQVATLSQLHLKALNINNLFEKESLRSEIAGLTNSIKSVLTNMQN